MTACVSCTLSIDHAHHTEIKQDLYITLFDLICKRGKLLHLKSMEHITPVTSDPLKAVAGFLLMNEMEKGPEVWCRDS